MTKREDEEEAIMTLRATKDFAHRKTQAWKNALKFIGITEEEVEKLAKEFAEQ